MSSVRPLESARLRIAPADIVLANWPVRDRKLVAWPLLGVLLGVSLAAGSYAGRAEVGLLFALVLGVATWRWWVPVTFSFTPAGVTTRLLGRSRRRSWSTFTRYEVLAEGVMLTAEDESSPVTTLRGMYVAWNDRRDELLVLLEFYLGAQAAESRWSRTTFDGTTPRNG